TAAGIIWRRKFWIVLLAILAGVGTFFAARVPSPSFSSASVIEITMQPTNGTPNETLLASNGLASQYAQLATTSVVLESAAKLIDVPAADISHAVTASAVGQVNLVKVSATGSSAEQSR